MTAMENVLEYVTATIGGQLFGLPISRVQDVFVPDRLTRIPLAPPEVAGLLNVRGRILTVIDMRRRLGVESTKNVGKALAIGVEHGGESYGLLIDSIGDVLNCRQQIERTIRSISSAGSLRHRPASIGWRGR